MARAIVKSLLDKEGAWEVGSPAKEDCAVAIECWTMTLANPMVGTGGAPKVPQIQNTHCSIFWRVTCWRLEHQ